MKVEKKDLEKAKIEVTVSLELSEFEPYIKKGAENLAKEVKVEGFRPGKAPYEVIKNKIGEMTILEEAAKLAINKTLDKALLENAGGKEPFGTPEVSVTKLAGGNPFEYKIVISVLPEVELADYKNCKVKVQAEKVSVKEVEKTLAQLREMRVKEVLADRPAGEGDKVLLDIEMFLDKVPVDGGQGKAVAAVIGNDHIIPGFDKQLIGAKKDDVKRFDLPFPEDHHMRNLAGKLVTFSVAVKDVYERQLPEMNDEFAVSIGLKDLAELKKNIEKSLTDEKNEASRQKTETEIIEKIMAASQFGDLPEEMIKNETRAMMAELEEGISSQGGKFDDYLSSLKKSREELALEMMPNAVKRVKGALLIREIAKRENITVTDKEIDDKVAELLKRYQGYAKVEERVKQESYRSYLASLLRNENVMEKLRQWNAEESAKTAEKDE